MAPQSTPTPAPKQLEILEAYCRNHQHRRLLIDSRELVLPKVSDGANRGLTITAFAVEDDALRWLLDPKSD